MPRRAIDQNAGNSNRWPDGLCSAGDALFLLQLCNSAFPTGAFNHSYGFETWIENGEVHDAQSFERRCRAWLRYCVATSDAAAVGHAHRLQCAGDGEGLARLDRLTGALKLSRESRDASLKTGRSLLTAAREVFRPPIIESYLTAFERAPTLGHQAVAFGVVGAAKDLDIAATVAAFLHSNAANLAGVASRLVPLGQTETQQVLRRLTEEIPEMAEVALDLREDEMGASTATLDAASMQHERLYTRLCMS
jgi:urease accessory protein